MDCGPPGSPVGGDFQIKILVWVAISLSRVSSLHKGWTHVPCVSCLGRWVLYHWATREDLFLCMGRCKSQGLLNYSFDTYLSSLGSVSCFSPSWIPSGTQVRRRVTAVSDCRWWGILFLSWVLLRLTVRAAVMWWLEGCNTISTDMAGNIFHW